MKFGEICDDFFQKLGINIKELPKEELKKMLECNKRILLNGDEAELYSDIVINDFNFKGNEFGKLNQIALLKKFKSLLIIESINISPGDLMILKYLVNHTEEFKKPYRLYQRKLEFLLKIEEVLVPKIMESNKTKK